MSAVIDASALLTLLLEEPGAEIVLPALRGSCMSAVNLSECMVRAIDRGHPAQAVAEIVDAYEVTVAAFDARQAAIASELRPQTRAVGASFGDRACLALAQDRAIPLLTADRRLAELDIGIDIRLIR